MAKPTGKKKEDAPKKKTEEVQTKKEKAPVKRQRKLVKAKDDVAKKKYMVPADNMAEINKLFERIAESVEEAGAFIEKLADKGKRAAAKEARAWVQEMIVTGKSLRKALQEAKMAVVVAESEDD